MPHLCPYGFVAPDNLNDTGITLIGTTGCALACISPNFTEDEWMQENNEILICSALGFSFSFILLITWIFDRAKSRQFIVVSISICICVVSLINVISSSILPLEKRFCRNSAVPISLSDGFNICMVQAVSNTYFSLSIAFCWAIKALDLFLKLRVELKNTDKYRWYYLITIIIPPAIPVCVALQSDKMGYHIGNLTCTTTSNNNFDIYSLYIPFLYITIIVLILSFLIFMKLTMVVNNKNLQRVHSLKDTWHVFRTSILSLIVFLLYFIVLIFARAAKYQLQTQQDKYMNEWTDCMFDSFYKGTDWKSICGIRPQGSTPLWIYTLLHIFAFGIGIFYSLIHLLSKSALLIWIKRWNRILRSLQSRLGIFKMRRNSISLSFRPLHQRGFSSKLPSRQRLGSMQRTLRVQPCVVDRVEFREPTML